MVRDFYPFFMVVGFLFCVKVNTSRRHIPLVGEGVRWYNSRLPRSASHSNLISLCRLLGFIAQDSNCLETSSLYITNAVKCDRCDATGKTGRVNVNNLQAAKCRERFLVKELVAVNASVLVFFGKNAQRYALGRTTPLWRIHREQLNGSSFWVMRVPHTSPPSFNTYGGRGRNYIAPFNVLCRRASISI